MVHATIVGAEPRMSRASPKPSAHVWFLSGVGMMALWALRFGHSSEDAAMSDQGRIGFIGLGSMGGNMVGTLLRSRYGVLAYDLVAERVAECVSRGAEGARDGAEIVSQCGVVMTSLRSSEQFIGVAEGVLLPNARQKQVFVDMGTTSAVATRRLAAAFAEKGAALVDAPVSGGPQGCAQGNLHIFVGGDEDAVARCWDILQALGDPERTVHCGPSGAGQVVKGVNQLGMGLGAAAYLEALAFGVRSGVSIDAIRQAVGGVSGWRAHFAAIADQVDLGRATEVYVKFPEFPYFIEHAEYAGFPMPLMESLYAFLGAAERSVRDNMGRPTVSFWQQLMGRSREA